MPTRDEPVYVRVEGEHILGTLISPGSLLPGVLFVHGWGGDQRQYVARAREIAALGCVCLTFDLRGHAQTQTRYDSVSREDSLRDILAAYDFLAAQHNVDSDSIAVVGSSYGGYLGALLTAKRPVKWLALRVPALYKDSEWSLPKLKLRGEQDLEKYRLQAVGPEESKALRACRAFTGDVLLVESEHDTVIPHQVIVNYREACISARSLTYRLIEGADHGLSSESMQAAYTQLLTKWFTEIVFCTKPAEPPPPRAEHRRAGDGARGGLRSRAPAAVGAADARRTGKMRGPPSHRETPMTAELLPCIEHETGPNPTAAVIWLHGLGADGNDFVPIVDEMRLPASLPIRFVFPHAPVRPVTLNNGFRMRAWYDLSAGRHHQSRRCRRRAGLAGAHRGADRAREGARHRRAAHRPRRILAGRRDRALHRRAPCRAAGGDRRLVDVRRAAGPARRRGECGQSRRADLHGARNVRSDGPTRNGAKPGGALWSRRATASNGTPTRCRIRSCGRRSRR